MSEIRVLHCINGMGSGGAEADIMNWFDILSKRGFIFDFLLRKDDVFYRETIKRLGGSIFITSSFPNHFIRNYKETKKFFELNHLKYNVIHVHGNSTFYILPLILAYKYKIPVRIFHAHSTKTINIISLCIHIMNRVIMKKCINRSIGCSIEATKFCKMDNPYIIHNMINFDKFSKHNVKKEQILKKYNLPEAKYIISNIGRLLKVKNQNFVIEVFKELLKYESNMILLLIGTGPLFEKLKKLSIDIGLGNKVFFLGEIDDVCDVLQIIDLMIFPSFYEGIPLTLLEAQAAEVKIIGSTNIDSETKITPYLSFIDLDKSADYWAEIAINKLEETIVCDVRELFRKANYDLITEANKLEKIYSGELV